MVGKVCCRLLHSLKIPWCACVILFTLGLLACASAPTGQLQDTTDDNPASTGLIAFYRGPLNHLRAVRHGPCPMHPSCSQYAQQAIAKHGPLLGTVMASDRLMRCGRNETQVAPRVLVNGVWKYHDPLHNNDRWWYRIPPSHPDISGSLNALTNAP
jgi:putative component of membrane protein insertase Oxa1/YidC/SpoIIIJ protein YidD